MGESGGAEASGSNDESSPITQVQLAASGGEAPAGDESGPLAPSEEPRRRSFLANLCLRCCGRAADADELSDAAPARTVYVPPAPHTGQPFIPPLQERDAGKKTLVLDLDETLVHSSFKPVPNPDYVIPVEIDGKVCEQQAPWHGSCARGADSAARLARCGRAVATRCGAPHLHCTKTQTAVRLLMRCRQITDVYVLKRPWVDHFLVRRAARACGRRCPQR